MTTEEIQRLRDTKTTFNWEQWDLANPLEDQEWSLLACPKCYHSESDPMTILANKDTGDFHCEKCGHLGNAKFAPNKFKGKLNFKNQWWKSPLTPTMIKWFERNYISKDTLETLDISVVNKKYFAKSNTMGFSVAIPCKLTPDGDVQDVHHIRIDPKGGFTNDMMTTVGAKTIPIGMDKISYDHVIVVDNIKDYFSFIESGMTSVICLPNNLDPLSPQTDTWDFLQNIETQMKQVKKFTFAFPNSERGFAIEEEISRRFGKDRSFRVRWQRDVDDILEPSAYDVFYEYGEDSLEDEISEAQPFPIKGIYELNDVEDRIDAAYEYGLNRGVSTGFPTLDTHYTVELSQWTLVTGIPGSGKSNFLDGLLVNLSKLHGWKHVIFSPENQPIDRYYASLIEKTVGKAFSKTSEPSKRMTPTELSEGKTFVNKYFKVMLPDEEEGNWSVEGILELAKAAVYRHGIKGIVIDPWNEVEHKRPAGMQETDYISYMLTKIRRFAKTHNVHVWIVAHPTKMTKGADGKYPVPTPYDVAGGANWRNKADNALTVHRNVGQIDEDIIDVHVQKIRFKEIGRVGMVSLRGDITCGCYYDDIDQQKRAMSLASPTPLSSKEIRIKAPLNTATTKMGFTEATPSLFHDPNEIFNSL